VSDISNLLSDENINIANVTVNVNRSIADLRLIIEVKDLDPAQPHPHAH
jgi:predicted amino acid-binding ACT domain protein